MLRSVFSARGVALQEDKGFKLQDGTICFKREAKIAVSHILPTKDDPRWDWTDVEQFRVDSLIDTAEAFSATMARFQRALGTLDQNTAEKCRMSMRWCFRGENERVLVDQYVCYWVALELLTFRPSRRDRIGPALLDLLKSTYCRDGLLLESECARAKKALYDARCEILHEGMRDIPAIEALITFVRHTVMTSLRKRLGLGSPSLPDAGTLSSLGIQRD